MSVQISIDTLELKNLSPDLIAINSRDQKCHLQISSVLTLSEPKQSQFEMREECPLITLDILDPNDSYTIRDGKLNWVIDTNQFQHLKASQPTLKVQFHITNKSTTNTDSSSVRKGFALIDIRELTTSSKVVKWCKVHGFKDAEVLIQAKITELLILPVSSAYTPNANPTNTNTKQNDVNDNNIDLYTFRLSIEEYEGFPELLGYFRENSLMQTFILKWNLFNETFQSDEFNPTINEYAPKPIEDIFELKCPKHLIMSRMEAQFPLNFSLFSLTSKAPNRPNMDIDNALACASISFPFPPYASQINSTTTGTGTTATTAGATDTPLTLVSGWFDMTVLAPFRFSDKHPSARIKVGMHLQQSAPSLEQFQNIPAVRRSIEWTATELSNPTATTSPPTAYDDPENRYEDDFESDEKPSPSPVKVTVTTNLTSSSAPSEREKTLVKDVVGIEKAILDSHQLHHYRFSIDIRTVCNLKRPCHLVVSFAYPHFGPSAMVRTQPTWVLPYTETKVDGGSGTYDCCLTPYQFNEILTAHPVKVQLSTKSHMGNGPIGEFMLDLSYIHSIPPLTYRCMVTAKTFTTLEEYSFHRHALIAGRSAGRHRLEIPPETPIIIRALDSYYPVISTDTTAGAGKSIADGAKVRALVVIEDMGRVGSEVAVPVRPGYIQQGAHIYDHPNATQRGFGNPYDSSAPAPPRTQNDGDAYEERGGLTSTDDLANGGGGGGGGDVFARSDLTAREKRRLEELRLEWETWQRRAEAEWREAMREKEVQLKLKLEADTARKLASQADDLKRAHEEAGRLEIRLRETIEAVDRQKAQLALKDEQLTTRLAQKTAELQLFQKRIREDAKLKIDAETRKIEV